MSSSRNKEGLLPVQQVVSPRHELSLSKARVLAALACALLFIYSCYDNILPVATHDVVDLVPSLDLKELCPQVGAMYPSKHADLDEQMDALYRTNAFQLDAFEKLGGAVRVPSVTFQCLQTQRTANMCLKF